MTVELGRPNGNVEFRFTFCSGALYRGFSEDVVGRNEFDRPGEGLRSVARTRMPLWPCSTSSLVPAMLVAITGTPAAMASISETGTPSARLGSTNKSACDNSCVT